jgi:hypothetical protein
MVFLMTMMKLIMKKLLIIILKTVMIVRMLMRRFVVVDAVGGDIKYLSCVLIRRSLAEGWLLGAR